MRRLLSILCTCVSILSPSANALEITYSSTNPFDGSVSTNEGLLLKGEIVPGDYEYLLEVLRNDPARFLNSTGFVLASPGGDIQEALKVAGLVKGTYSAVFVGPATGPCVSACFFIFAAAAERDAVPPYLGIHRPYVHPRRLVSVSVREAEALQKDVLRQARTYLENLDVPTNLIDKMFQQASTEVYWLSQDEINEQLGRHSPWYEQLLIARCGHNRSFERKAFSTNDHTMIDQVAKVANCGHLLSLSEARAFLKSELKNPSSR
jgi:hypothetical protein